MLNLPSITNISSVSGRFVPDSLTRPEALPLDPTVVGQTSALDRHHPCHVSILKCPQTRL